MREVPSLGRIVQITAPISHGNSGSPVFNMKGQVIGVVTIKVTNGQNINLALGAARLSKLAGRPTRRLRRNRLASGAQAATPTPSPSGGTRTDSTRSGSATTTARSRISRTPSRRIRTAPRLGFRWASARSSRARTPTPSAPSSRRFEAPPRLRRGAQQARRCLLLRRQLPQGHRSLQARGRATAASATSDTGRRLRRSRCTGCRQHSSKTVNADSSSGPS